MSLYAEAKLHVLALSRGVDISGGYCCTVLIVLLSSLAKAGDVQSGP